MRCVLALLSLALMTACAAPAAADRQILVLDHATLIDGRGGPPLVDRTIVIRGEHITSVQLSTEPVPLRARRVDMTGRWIIPGLIDSHVHLKTRPRGSGVMEQILASILTRSGVTTVRDMGGRGQELAALAERARTAPGGSPDIIFPALFTGPRSSFWLSGEVSSFIADGTSPGSSAWFRHFDQATDFGPAVRDAKALGARGIKAHSGFNADQLRALGDAARREGLGLWAHSHVDPARPSDAVSAGAATISHADMLAYEGLDEVPDGFERLGYIARTRVAMSATPVDGERLGALFQSMRDRGVCLEPTLQVFTPRAPDPAMDDYAGYAAQATGRAHRTGVSICAGTDGIGGSTANLPIELELLVQRAGLKPLEAITAATRNNARALGLVDRGVIASGLRADLVVLCADPSINISAVKSVAAVVSRGAFLPLGSDCAMAKGD